MTPIDVSIVLAGVLIFLVVIGVRVAFATGFIGFLGILLIFLDRGQSFDRALLVTLQIAGQVPHSKMSIYVLALIPTFILIGYLAYYAGLTMA
ncbi:MAG: TRAP transporter large permease, partial [Pseudomonadota bacterium]